MVYIKDKATIDPKTKSVILARDGIYRYLGSELGIAGDNTIYNVRRTTRSVQKVADDINRLGVLPITIEHPKNFLDLNSDKSFAKGGVGNCTTEVIDGVHYVKGQIVSINDDADELLNKGREVSLGSKAEISRIENDPEADFEMDVTGVNHLAILNGKGRCGSACSITDGLTNKEFLIEELLKMDKKNFTLSDVEKMIDEKMKKFTEEEKSNSEEHKKIADEDEVKKAEEKSEDKVEDKSEEKSEDKSETKSDDKVEAKDSIEQQLKQATADGLDKGMATAQHHYKIACKFIDRGLIEAKELEDKLPCEVVDNKLKELFDMETIEQDERNGLIKLALSDKKQFNDAWSGWGAVKKDEPKKETKKSFSIFR